MSSESFGYRLYTLDRATGRTLDSMTLMRFNQHDLGEFEEHFTGFRKLQRTPSARAIWSPDSSKFVIFKYYPSSTGRMNMELMLFRRGFVLATKTNIDFRLDPNKQNLLSLKLDNDGVAYLFKYDNVDTSFEVGRFEILGSKSLSAIKYKANDVPKIARMSIAPRGHTYLALMHEVDAGHQFSLIDFDFYRSATSMTDTVLPLDPIPLLQPQPLEIHVMPLDDRIVLTFESQSMQYLARVDQLAYNMDIQPQWHATYTKPIEFIGRHRFASGSKLLTKDLGHFFIEEDTLRFRSIDITTGRRSTDPRYERLAIAEGVQPGALDLAILDRKQLYVAAQKLFRLTLP